MVGVVLCGLMIAVAMEADVVSKYVVEKGSDFGIGFRKVVLSGGEVVYKCVRCPCVFSSLHDVGLHVAVCGERREKNVFMYGVLIAQKKIVPTGLFYLCQNMNIYSR